MREKALFVGWLLGVVVLVAMTVAACTAKQRAIVRDVTQLVEDVCAEADPLDVCLGKMQAHRAAASASPDAGAAP